MDMFADWICTLFLPDSRPVLTFEVDVFELDVCVVNAHQIALPTRIPREAARHVFATPASRAPMDNALRARRERSRLRRDLLHAQTVGREPIRLPQLR